MNAEKHTILIVDDEESIRKLLKARFEREGFPLLIAENGTQALQVLADHPSIAVIVTDVRMPGKGGLELTQEVKKNKNSPKVIVMTGHGEKSTAIEALRFGASDYLEKPFDMEEMTHSVKRTMNEYRLEQENQDFIQRLEARVARVEGKEADLFWYVSKARAMEPVNEWLKVLQRESMRGEAEEPSTLIVGESGTGKEGIARMIHAGSRRAKGPWIAVNCANFSETLLESELFGHEKGSFTGATQAKRGLFEIAKEGTLFLDELGEMDIRLQSRLLRVIQEKTFRRVGGTTDIHADVRVISATNQNLQRYIQEGKFRDDLYHRIAKVVIDLPALRFRPEDIVPMSKQFFERSFQTRGKTFDGLSASAEASLQGYSWPGNVRELLNVVERTALLWNKKGAVEGKDIVLPTPSTQASTVHHDTTPNYEPTQAFHVPIDIGSGTFNYTQLKKKWADGFEKEYLISILGRHLGNVTAASKEAGVDRSNFLRLLRRHQISAQNYRDLKRDEKKAA